jgi:hypothetical protein
MTKNLWVLSPFLTPKIPGPFLPISTSKMLKFSKKSQKKIPKIKNAEILTP